MFNRFKVLSSSALLWFASVCQAQRDRSEFVGREATDSIIVKFNAEAPRDSVLRSVIAENVDGQVVWQGMYLQEFAVIRVPSGTVERSRYYAEAFACVEYTSADRYGELASVPNDPIFGDQWFLHNTGQTANGYTGTSGADIRAPTGWDVRTDATSIVIAVIDSGVDLAQPQLSGRIWQNSGEIPNGLDDDNNGIIDDMNGAAFLPPDECCARPQNDPGEYSCQTNPFQGNHGTPVACLIGARGNDNSETCGVAWDCTIMPIRLMARRFPPPSPPDYCGLVLESSYLASIDYAIRMGAKIINCSWSLAIPVALPIPLPDPLYDAMGKGRDAGVLFVVAAGNFAK